MIYYQRHIGDYAKKAGHLSLIEHGVYTILLDQYYDREQGPTHAEAVRWTRARSSAELAALEAVLNEFFQLVDGRYVQTRVEDEFAKWAEYQQKQRDKGKKGGRPRKAADNPEETRSFSGESQTKAEKSLTTNQLTNNQDKAPAKAGPISLDAFIEACTERGEKPVPADDPIFAYAESIELPGEYLALAWSWFKVARSAAKQKGVNGWRAHFRDAVKGNWPKYWYALEGGGWGLTTAGKQAQRAQA